MDICTLLKGHKNKIHDIGQHQLSQVDGTVLSDVKVEGLQSYRPQATSVIATDKEKAAGEKRVEGPR